MPGQTPFEKTFSGTAILEFRNYIVHKLNL